MSRKDNFAEQVYQIVKQIPKGKVSTYGQIAARLGKPKAARAVGNVLHVNPYKSVSCHRVVNREGRVAKNFGGGGWQKQKQRLLDEGVTFIDKLHIDFKQHRYRIDDDRHK